MEANEKSEQLYNKMLRYQSDSGFSSLLADEYAINSAIICVDEIMNSGLLFIQTKDFDRKDLLGSKRYWKEVKKHLEEML